MAKHFRIENLREKITYITKKSMLIHSSGEKNVTTDPLTLFLLLLVAIEREPENERANYFNYELIPFPMSLFKDGSALQINLQLKPFC